MVQDSFLYHKKNLKIYLTLNFFDWMQEKERYSSDKKDSAPKIANFLLNEARKLRTKDNTSILYVDCDTAFRTLCKYDC